MLTHPQHPEREIEREARWHEMGAMLTPTQLVELCADMKHVEVTQADRKQMAIGLFLQGYSAGRACHLAYVELDNGDGALQMLARHRIFERSLP